MLTTEQNRTEHQSLCMCVWKGKKVRARKDWSERKKITFGDIHINKMLQIKNPIEIVTPNHYSTVHTSTLNAKQFTRTKKNYNKRTNE